MPPASSKALGTKREYFFRNVFFIKRISVTTMSCCFRCRKTLRTFLGVADTLFHDLRKFFIFIFDVVDVAAAVAERAKEKKKRVG